jgi:hypothetical protein
VGGFDEKLRPALEALLEPGETLDGICACSQQKGMFSGGAVALGVTPKRLLIQPLSRGGDPEGEAQSIAPADIASAKAEGAGSNWPQIGAAIMDKVAVKLTLKLNDGEKLRLMMMHGEGSPALKALGGGESQHRGVQALAEWFQANG